MLLEGIQSEKLCKIRSNADDEEGVDAAKALNALWLGKFELPWPVFTISDAQMNIIARQLKSNKH